MLTKLKLYGDLGKFIGHKEFDIHANTVAKAVSFLINNFPQAEAYMNNRNYAVLVNNVEIDETELHDLSGTQEIKFIPVISGAGRGFGKILTGVSEMLFPLPDNDMEGDPRISFSFTGLQNTSRAGTPVPICYGEILTGSVVISADITTDEVEA